MVADARPYESEPVVVHPEVFPTPPMQGAPWTAPAEADATRVEVARFLFEEAGAPDPRGCPRHRVAITVSDLLGRVRAVTTTAWVLPQPAADGRRFVIAPDGLVYLAHAVRERVADDDRSLLAEQSPRESELEVPVGIAELLMLRAGVAPLAAGAPTPADAGEVRSQQRSFASWWAWLQMERAAAAHGRGDDPLALHDLESLAGLAADHGWALIRRSERFGEVFGAGTEELEALLSDQRRRARIRRENGDERASGAVQNSREASVPELIERLDQVAVPVDRNAWPSAPFPLDWLLTQQPVLQALIAIGDAAVEPLIEVLETDERLTRTVLAFQPQMTHQLTVLEVPEAALAALRAILHRDFDVRVPNTGDFRERMRHRRLAQAAAIRAYWARSGGAE